MRTLTHTGDKLRTITRMTVAVCSVIREVIHFKKATEGCDKNVLCVYCFMETQSTVAITNPLSSLSWPVQQP